MGKGIGEGERIGTKSPTERTFRLTAQMEKGLGRNLVRLLPYIAFVGPPDAILGVSNFSPNF
jgi:hypothetical protein